MAETNLLSDDLDLHNVQVLKSYVTRSKAAKAADAEHNGWVDRLESTEDLDSDQLTRIHGELIALGMLKFELANRQAGLQYRVSDRGKAALSRHTARQDTEQSDEAQATTSTDPATPVYGPPAPHDVSHDDPVTPDTEIPSVSYEAARDGDSEPTPLADAA